jgi:hypothetical protein
MASWTLVSLHSFRGLQVSLAKAKPGQSSLIRQYRGPVPARRGEEVGPRAALAAMERLARPLFQVLYQKYPFRQPSGLANFIMPTTWYHCG